MVWLDLTCCYQRTILIPSDQKVKLYHEKVFVQLDWRMVSVQLDQRMALIQLDCKIILIQIDWRVILVVQFDMKVELG